LIRTTGEDSPPA